MGRYGIKDVKGNEFNVMLKGVNISGNICGEFGEFSIEHIYENKSKSNIEATYTFPIPESAVLCGFEAVLGDRNITGIVREKKETEKAYEDAVETGKATFLMEQLEINKFKISIGRIIPNESVKIKITYLDELVTNEDNTLKLTIPTIVEAGNIDDYKISLNLLIESFSKLKFKSLTHAIKVEREDDTFSKISFLEENEYMDTDFVLTLREEDSVETTGMIYKNPKEDKGIIYLRLLPEIDTEEVEDNNNYVFLIDISESMEGKRLERAKNALQICLRNLSEGDTFNMLAFGREMIYFNENEQVSYNEENLYWASQWLNDLKVDGEANVFVALKDAINIKNEMYKTILLFTDDVVKNENEVLNYIKENIGENRIFPFGIGASVNNYFINKLAQYGRGKAEFISDTEKIERTILRQFSRIESPQVTDVNFDWGSMKVGETYPRTIEYMYEKEPFSVFATVTGEIEGVVSVSGKYGELDYLREINLDNLDLEENANLISKVWYWKRIESISEKLRGERGKTAEDMRQKVIELSQKSGIVCDYTSFVIVEEREEPVLGIQLKNIIPLKVTNKQVNKREIGDDKAISPGFSYKFLLNRRNIHYDKYYLDDNYPRQKILSIIARNQFADGSFADYVDRNEVDKKVKATALALLTFTLGKEDIKIYINQLKKSIVFLEERINNNTLSNDSKIVLFALNSCLNKGIFNSKTKERIKVLIEKLVDENRINETIDNKLLFNRQFMKKLFTFSKDGKYIQEKITLQEEKNNIYILAKLGILELLNK